ncbi:MAG TPA: hypothetical protein VI318_26520 [Baekduia sp.]
MGLDVLVHALAVLTAAWAAHHPGFGYGLSDTHQVDGAVSTSGGVVAWWGSEGGKDPRLTVWRRGRAPERLAIAMSPGHPLLDVGPGPDGAPWVVYPKCDKNACRIRGYDLRTRRDADLGVGAGVAAAIWRHDVLVYRQARPRGPATLALATIGGGAGRRLPLPRSSTGWGDPIGVDLRGDRMAYAAWEAGEDARVVTLSAGRIADAAQLPTIAFGGSGEECTQTVSSPTLTASGLTWLAAVTATENDCGHHTRVLRHRDWATGAVSHAQVLAVSPKEAVVAAGRVIALGPQPHDDGPDDRDACVPDDERANGCQVRLTPPPRWLPGAGK